MNPLESRKQLLIAESELNRAQLVQEWQMMAGEVHSLTSQARTISSIASAVATSGCRPVILPAQKIRARRRKTFVVADHPERRGAGQFILAGIPLAGLRTKRGIATAPTSIRRLRGFFDRINRMNRIQFCIIL